MFAIVEDGKIIRTGSSVQKMFPNTSFAGSPNADFLRDNNVMDVVNGERKNEQYYFVTAGDITLVDGVPTQAYTNTAKLLADEDAKDVDGNQIYVQVWDADANDGDGGYVNSSEKVVNQGLKTTMTDIPSATATYRAAVLTECARLETAIANAADVDALAAVMAAQNWPKE